MASMFPIIILMGFMIVLAAFVVGYLNSQTAASYFAETKTVRESTLLAERASIESVGFWLPYAKFLGLGLILGGIVMALRKIIDAQPLFRIRAGGNSRVIKYTASER